MEDLEDTQDFVEGALPGVVPLDDGEIYSNDEGNGSVAERGDNSNNYLSPPVHFEIP